MPASKRASNRKGPGTRPAPPATQTAPGTVAVRMLYGERAGQIVQVPKDEVPELLQGWPTARAELVAVNRAQTRETR